VVVKAKLQELRALRLERLQSKAGVAVDHAVANPLTHKAT